MDQPRKGGDAEEQERQRGMYLQHQWHARHQRDIGMQREYTANPGADGHAVLIGAVDEVVAQREDETRHNDEPQQGIRRRSKAPDATLFVLPLLS